MLNHNLVVYNIKHKRNEIHTHTQTYSIYGYTKNYKQLNLICN